MAGRAPRQVLKPALVSRVGHLLNDLCFLVANKDDKNKASLISGGVSAWTSGMSCVGRGRRLWTGDQVERAPQLVQPGPEDGE